ncbi:hypothetical protein STEG23_018290 [Scotinomys teguina]
MGFLITSYEKETFTKSIIQCNVQLGDFMYCGRNLSCHHTEATALQQLVNLIVKMKVLGKPVKINYNEFHTQTKEFKGDCRNSQITLMENISEVAGFILVGLTDAPELQVLLFVTFTIIYLITLFGNLGMLVLILLDSRLHTPMYIFLSNLSFVDCVYASAVTPKSKFDGVLRISRKMGPVFVSILLTCVFLLVGKIFFNDFVKYVFCAFELIFFSFFYSYYLKYFV